MQSNRAQKLLPLCAPLRESTTPMRVKRKEMELFHAGVRQLHNKARVSTPPQKRCSSEHTFHTWHGTSEINCFACAQSFLAFPLGQVGAAPPQHKALFVNATTKLLLFAEQSMAWSVDGLQAFPALPRQCTVNLENSLTDRKVVLSPRLAACTMANGNEVQQRAMKNKKDIKRPMKIQQKQVA